MTDTNITVTQTQTIVSPAIKYDPSYCRTIPGIVKIVCIVSILFLQLKLE